MGVQKRSQSGHTLDIPGLPQKPGYPVSQGQRTDLSSIEHPFPCLVTYQQQAQCPRSVDYSP